MAIHHQYPDTKERIWEGIIQLVVEGRAKTIQVVIDELENNAEYANGAHMRLAQIDKSKLLVDWHPFILRAGQIAQEFPRLSPPNNPRLKADALLVAIAEQQQFTIVHQESRKGKKPNMYAACNHFRVACKLLNEFVEEENLE